MWGDKSVIIPRNPFCPAEFLVAARAYFWMFIMPITRLISPLNFLVVNEWYRTSLSLVKMKKAPLLDLMFLYITLSHSYLHPIKKLLRQLMQLNLNTWTTVQFSFVFCVSLSQFHTFGQILHRKTAWQRL